MDYRELGIFGAFAAFVALVYARTPTLLWVALFVAIVAATLYWRR